MSVEALREGAEHGLRDAETHPPGAPGAAGRAGAERWRGGLLLHGAGRGCGLADRGAVQPEPGVTQHLCATRLPLPGAAGAPRPAPPAAPAGPAPTPGAQRLGTPPGVPQ